MTIERIGLALRSESDKPADLYTDDSGNLALARNSQAVAQHARQRLMTFEGEWFLDAEAGVPWLRDILGKNYDPALAESVVKSETLDTDGVVEITDFSIGFDTQKRGVNIKRVRIVTEYDEAVAV